MIRAFHLQPRFGTRVDLPSPEVVAQIDYFRFADHTRPESCWLASRQYPGMLLTNSDLPSHAINQLLGIVADPSLKYRLDVLDLVNSF
jgi:hypothetical protein